MARLVAEIDARPSREGARIYARSADDIRKKARQVDRAVDRNDRGFGRLKKSAFDLRGAFAGIGIGLLARKFVDLADQSKLLTARVDLVTKSNAELLAVQRELSDIAQETRSDLVSTTELYARVARSADELGLSQRDVLTTTEAVAKAIKVSGATAAESSAGIIQLAQGLASGALRGDELRSVMEQLPRLARAIAEGMGKSIGEIRKLGEEGKLTAQAVIEALLSQKETLDKEFALIPQTVSDAFTKVKNRAIELVGEFDKSTGVSDRLANAVGNVADNLESVARGALAISAAALPALLAKVAGSFAALAAVNPFGAIASAISVAVAAAILFKDEQVTLGGETVRVGSLVLSIWDTIASAIDTAITKVRSFFNELSALSKVSVPDFFQGNRPETPTVDSLLDFLGRPAGSIFQDITGTQVRPGSPFELFFGSQRTENLANNPVDRAIDARGVLLPGGPQGPNLPNTEQSNQLDEIIQKAKEYAAQLRNAFEETENINASLQTTEDILSSKGGGGKASSGGIAGAVQDVIDGFRQQASEAKLVLAGQADMIPLVRAEAELREQLGRELIPQERDALRDAFNEAQRLGNAVERQAEFQRQFQVILDRSLENIQDNFAQTWLDVFDNGINGFKGFFNRVLDIAKQTAAQLLALFTFQNFIGPIFQPLIAGLGASLGGGFGGTAAGIGGIGAAGAGSGFNPLGAIATLLSAPKQAFTGLASSLGLGAGASNLLGIAGSGALFGGLTAGLFGLPGKTGATIGGGLGAVGGELLGPLLAPILGPLAGIAGPVLGAVGSIVGGLFGKKPKSFATISTSGLSDIGKAGKGDKAVAQGLGQSVLDQLQSFADAVGADLLSGFQVGQIGQRKKDFIFSETPTGSSRFGAPKKDADARHFSTPEAAVEAAVLSALRGGALTGLSEKSQEILKSATNIADAIEQITAIEQAEQQITDLVGGLSDAILQLTDPQEFAKRQLLRSQAERLTLFRQSNADLAQVEKLFFEERTALLDQFSQQSIGTLRGFLDELNFGALSFLSEGDRFRALSAQFTILEQQQRAGLDIDPNALVSTGQAFLRSSREVQGASADFFADRQRVIDLTVGLLNQTESANVEFLNRTLEPQLKELTDGQQEAASRAEDQRNDMITELRELRRAVGGGGFGGGAGGSFETGIDEFMR